MSKETFYFPHDFEPTSDPKIQAMIGNFGGVGYGVFWRIIEMLHSNAEHKLPLKKYIFEAIAKQMLTSAEQIEAMVKTYIADYELFTSDGVFFWSERVFRNFQKRMEISKVRSEAGKKGAIAKQNLANASKGKERKVKESKEKEKKKMQIVPPTIDDFKKYFAENGYQDWLAEKAYKHYSGNNWKSKDGKSVINWKSKLNQVWFKEEGRIQPQKKREVVH